MESRVDEEAPSPPTATGCGSDRPAANGLLVLRPERDKRYKHPPPHLPAVKATITYQVEAPTIQKVTALRDRLSTELEADPDTTLLAATSAQVTRTYHVIGVDTKTSKVSTKDVEAQSEEDAKAQAETKTWIVAYVT